LHLPVFLLRVPWDLLFSVDSASFVDLLQPTLQILIFEEVRIVLDPCHAIRLRVIEDPTILCTIRLIEVESFSGLFALVLLMLEQDLGDIEISLLLRTWEPVRGP